MGSHGKRRQSRSGRGQAVIQSMTSLKGDSPEDSKYVYVIYEKGHKDYCETVSFVKIHLYGGK